MRSPDQLVAALRAVAERDDAVSREAVYTVVAGFEPVPAGGAR